MKCLEIVYNCKLKLNVVDMLNVTCVCQPLSYVTECEINGKIKLCDIFP